MLAVSPTCSSPYFFLFFDFVFLCVLSRAHGQALQHAAFTSGSAKEDGEVADVQTDIAGNTDALMLQGRTRYLVARKAVADAKLVHREGAAAALLWECGRRKAAEASPAGQARLTAACHVFHLRAKAFVAAREKQLALDLRPDLPFAQTLFPDIDETNAAEAAAELARFNARAAKIARSDVRKEAAARALAAASLAGDTPPPTAGKAGSAAAADSSASGAASKGSGGRPSIRQSTKS